MESSAAGVGFDITSQQLEPTFDPNSPEAGLWTIHFKTRPSGVDAFVTVPSSRYTPETVGRLIAQQAATIESVHRLGQGG